MNQSYNLPIDQFQNFKLIRIPPFKPISFFHADIPLLKYSCRFYQIILNSKRLYPIDFDFLLLKPMTSYIPLFNPNIYNLSLFKSIINDIPIFTTDYIRHLSIQTDNLLFILIAILLKRF